MKDRSEDRPVTRTGTPFWARSCRSISSRTRRCAGRIVRRARRRPRCRRQICEGTKHAGNQVVAERDRHMSQTRGVQMRHTRLLSAIAVSLWSAVVIGGQAATPVALAGALRDQVKNGRFGMVTSVRGLPLGVRDGLQALFGSRTLDIAEPKAEFQATGVIVNPMLPFRRLVAAGCTIDHCLVYYERGGTTHSWHVALFHWTPAATRFEWGGTAPAGLATIDDVRAAILSGSIRSPAPFW